MMAKLPVPDRSAQAASAHVAAERRRCADIVRAKMALTRRACAGKDGITARGASTALQMFSDALDAINAPSKD